MNNLNSVPVISPDDLALTEQMFETDFSSYNSAPYDMDYEIIYD